MSGSGWRLWLRRLEQPGRLVLLILLSSAIEGKALQKAYCKTFTKRREPWVRKLLAKPPGAIFLDQLPARTVQNIPQLELRLASEFQEMQIVLPQPCRLFTQLRQPFVFRANSLELMAQVVKGRLLLRLRALRTDERDFVAQVFRKERQDLIVRNFASPQKHRVGRQEAGVEQNIRPEIKRCE